MALDSMLRRGISAFACGALALLVAPPAHAFRIVNYNLTNYPGPDTNPATRNSVRLPMYRTILAPLSPDIVACQEVRSQAGVDTFVSNVLNVIEPGQWAAAPFTLGNDTNNALFYKPAKFTLLGTWAFYPNPANPLRLVNVYRLRPVGYLSGAAEIRIYSQHLKASSGSANVAQRLAEAAGIRDSMNNVPPGTHGILLGDFNVYTSTEPGYQKLLENQADNDGRLYDPLNAIGTWNNAAFAAIHTQCPCLTCPTSSGYSGGGLDDRFDQFLPTYAMKDGEGVDLLVSTYKPVGNDGLHYNININDAPVIPEGQAYANALWGASDHLPIRVDVQLPARVQVATTPIAFGTVIVGAPNPVATLTVTNAPPAPADTLEYAYGAPAGFTAPAGPLALLAGASNNDAIAMDASSVGARSGNLTLNSNDLDTPSLAIALSGTVLAHAQASLDGAAALTSTTLDFGDQPEGGFSDQSVSVHNLGYNALQARLSVTGASITGTAAARFAFVPALTPELVAQTAASYGLHFDDNAAPLDSTYEADVTFASADEPLPGASARPALSVHLRARVTSGTVDVPRLELPTATRLYAPFPNPLVGFSSIRFDLAKATHATLQVFDLSGRRVASIADRDFDAGSYTMRWNGHRDDGQRPGAGIYFVRLSGAGIPTCTARIAVIE